MATLLSSAPNYRGAGIHQYSKALLTHLPSESTAFDFHAFLMDRDFTPPEAITAHRATHLSPHPLNRILWEQTQVAWLSKRLKLQLLHGFAYALPLALSIPTVVTVHDLTFLHFPDAFPKSKRLYLTRITAQSCRRSEIVIADSKATARDIETLLQIPAENISVIYPGVDPRYRRLPKAQVEAYRRRKGWPTQFLLMVGTLEPRKNHLGLLEAYSIYRKMAQHPLPLLIGGGKGWRYKQIFESVQERQLEDHVHFLGFVPWEDLPWLYNAATLFIYPSRYEGFGFPVVEAMRCGVPVITSTVSSLPEVAGDAAITVDPDDHESLANAIWELTEAQPEQRETLSERGIKHAQRFQWSQTALQTARVYARVLNIPHV